MSAAAAEVQSITLSEDQRPVYEAILKWVRTPGVQTLSMGGWAGTGKSTLVAKLLDEIASKKNVCVCAYTGKAASVLRSKGIEQARTLHSLIYQPMSVCKECGEFVSDDDPVVQQYCDRAFRRIPYLVADLVIVDEASMLNRRLVDDLESYGQKILYVGDHGQLEPIGDNPGIMMNPDLRLEQIHRQAAGSPIIRFAHALRRGDDPRKYIGFQKEGLRILRVSDLAEPEQYDVVLCGFNRTRVKLNAQIRERLGFEGAPTSGDWVICLQNNREHGIFNGQRFRVQSCRESSSGYQMDLVDELGVEYERIPVSTHAFGAQKVEPVRHKRAVMDWGYCITTHKCVAGNTLIETGSGLHRIDEIESQSGTVATIDGPRPFTSFIRRRKGKLLTLLCEQGFQITVTPDHKMRTHDGSGWVFREARALKDGNFLRIQLGEIFPRTTHPRLPKLPKGDSRAKKMTAPAVCSEEFAEFCGLMVADGTLFKSGFRLVKRNQEVVQRFAELSERLFSAQAKPYPYTGYPGVQVNSSILATWLRTIGGMSPHRKQIPGCILSSPISTRAAFLRGLFEDGTVNKNRGKADHIEWSNKSEELARLVQAMLLEFGIISSLRTRAQKTRAGKSRSHTSLYIYSDGIGEFAKRIRFISPSKNERLELPRSSNRKFRIPICRDDFPPGTSLAMNARNTGYISRASAQSLGMTDELRFHYVRIKRIVTSSGKSYCLTVPACGAFLQNRFDGSNSQGSQFEKVAVIEELHDSWSAARWSYTAATRASNQLDYYV